MRLIPQKSLQRDGGGFADVQEIKGRNETSRKETLELLKKLAKRDKKLPRRRLPNS